MTREDALAVIGVLSSAFPRAIGQQTIETYASQIGVFEAEVAMRAVMKIARQDDRFPSLAALLSAIRSETADAIPVLDEEPLLSMELPHWVGVQKHARAVGDIRVVPEQIPGYVEVGMPLPQLPWDLDDESIWVQPGEYGYVPSGYPWGVTGQVFEVCCFHPEDAGLPTKDVMVVGPLMVASFRMCRRCAATYEHRRAA